MDSDVIIIGAGVIGCAIAYNLGKAGVKTLVIDKADGVGREASWAGAGVLTSHASTREPYPALCRASLALYPSLADELKASTRIDIEFIQSGTLSLFFDEEEKDGLIGLAERRIDRGFSAEVLTAEQVWEIEPAVSKSVVGGVRFPEDAQVRNPKLVRALSKGAVLSGARFLLGNPVDGFVREKDRISGVKVNGELFRGDTIVIAAGCWSGALAKELGVHLPIQPSRGQIVLVDTIPLVLRHTIDGLGVYVVPRSDGKILIGATVEFVGYDKRTTLVGVQQMIEAGTTLIPELAEMSFTQAWAGLRPHIRNGPCIGKLPDLDNVIIASGHFKNGILLAPITGALISELITTGVTSLSLEPFSPSMN